MKALLLTITVACCMPDGDCWLTQPEYCGENGGQTQDAYSCDVVNCTTTTTETSTTTITMLGYL
jgi:hypothetical protein